MGVLKRALASLLKVCILLCTGMNSSILVAAEGGQGPSLPGYVARTGRCGGLGSLHDHSVALHPSWDWAMFFNT